MAGLLVHSPNVGICLSASRLAFLRGRFCAVPFGVLKFTARPLTFLIQLNIHEFRQGQGHIRRVFMRCGTMFVRVRIACTASNCLSSVPRVRGLIKIHLKVKLNEMPFARRRRRRSGGKGVGGGWSNWADGNQPQSGAGGINKCNSNDNVTRRATRTRTVICGNAVLSVCVCRMSSMRGAHVGIS